MSSFTIKSIKRKLIVLRLLLAKTGRKKAEIIKKNGFIGSMGDNCWYEPFRVPAEMELVHFGNNVNVATEVMFMNHDLTATMFNNKYKTEHYRSRKGEIHIGDNVFIGARSTILYNVNIGNNVIIGAGSVITKDIPDNCVVAGVPAKFIKTFDEYKAKMDKACEEGWK